MPTTILEEIQTWSQDLPEWQQDALSRLYSQRKLSTTDLDDLYALAKSEVGIPDPEGRVAKRRLNTAITAPQDSTRLVQVAGIKNLSNVNALAEGERLPIAPTGLTVIYGENGAGKSGYSRIFKHACRARDQREPVLANANLDPGTAGSPRAVFETIIDGEQVDLSWDYDEPAPEPLNDIAIFDSHCAHAYIDNQGDFAYAPDGLDVLEGLAKASTKLKERATQDQRSNAPSGAAFAELMRGQTGVSEALHGIPARTKSADIETLATLSNVELERLTLLNKALSEPDPKRKAAALRQKAARLSGLKDRIIKSVAAVSAGRIDELRTLVGRSNAAKKAAELASEQFKKAPDQLPGTGGEEWKVLFEAAREFSEISQRVHVFPHLPEDSACPLCQNPLGSSGAERFSRFEEFVKGETETAAKTARELAATTYRSIQQANLDLLIDEALSQELNEISSQLATSCAGLQAKLKARQEDTLQAAGGRLEWDEVTNISDDPRAALNEHSSELLRQAKALEESADEKAKAKMQEEYSELEARRRLCEVKGAVLEAIGKHDYCQKLQRCIDGMDTRSISRKSTDLSRTIASQELADALNSELKRLKVHELNVVMKPASPGGRTQFKLTLELPNGRTPAAILSEGEQRAIALASFLSEIKLGQGLGGVVFDDPVSSLDHRRRWEVAQRLAEESLDRQVIIFTHDIYFLCILEQKAQESGATLTKTYIRRTKAGFGVPFQSLPFDVLGTKGRVGQLREMLTKIRKAKECGDEDNHRALTARAYGYLRLAWERCVEEVLLNGSIQRFGEGVATQRLQRVVVTNEDYSEIDTGMSKCSKFEHDAAMSVGRLPVPDPDELSNDIEKLETWRREIIGRQGAIAAERK